MAYQTCGNRLYTSPTGASGATLTSSSTSWANSAYAEVLASAPVACVLTGMFFRANTDGNTDMEFDVATGGAGSEVVIATFRTHCGWQTENVGILPLAIPIDNIASGARVSIRMRKDRATAVATSVGIFYIQKPVVGTLQVSTQPTKAMPSAIDSVAIINTVDVWTNSAWVQVASSLATDLAVVGVVCRPEASTNAEWDLGTGAVSSEVVKTTFRTSHALGRHGLMIPVFAPLILSSGSRVAVRMRKQHTSDSSGHFSMMYQELPL